MKSLPLALQHTDLIYPTLLPKLLHAMAEAVIVVDSDSRIALFNRGAEELFGYARDELLGRPLHVLIPEHSPGPHAAHVARSAAHADTTNLLGGRTEIQGSRKDGSTFIADASIGRVPGKGDSYHTAILIHVIGRDLENAERDRRLVHELIEFAPIGFALFSLDGRMVDVNAAYAEIIGESIEGALAKSYFDVNPSKYKERDRADFEQLITTGYLPVHEREYVHADGHLVPVSLSGIKVRRGDEDFVWAIVEDVSAKKKQIEVESSLAHAQRIAHIGSYSYDVKTRAMQWSDEMYRLFGKDSESFTPTVESFYEAIHPEDREVVQAAAEASFRQDAEYLVHFRIPVADGGYRFVRGEGDVTFNEADEAIRLTGTVQDITEHEELQAQLRQSQKMEAVGLLTGGIAHDFNNVLAIIIGSLDLYATTDTVDGAKELVDHAMHAAQRGAETIRRLLAFARQQPLHPEQVEVGELVRNTAVLIERAIGERFVVEVDVADGSCRCVIDRPQLESALINLALNARDAMYGGGRIRIEVALVPNVVVRQWSVEPIAAERFVRVTVSDDGCGMSKAVQARALDPFFSTKERSGTGLGLSMVQGFIRQSNGYIRLISEEGIGTSVVLYLPLDDGPEDNRGTPSQGVEKEAFDGSGRAALVVEDNVDVLAFAVAALQKLGFTVFSATDVESALEVLDAHSEIDLLFADVVLVGGSLGTDLARRAVDVRPNLRVLLTSGYADAGVMNEIESNRWPFLAKPFGLEQLASKLRKAYTDDVT